ncbi:hypothetical protein ACTHQI_11190, partial [Micrococcus luteus]
MPKMSGIETAFCRSALWGRFARDIIVPWSLGGQDLGGDVLELGAGSGQMAAALLQRSPGMRLTLTDIDERRSSPWKWCSRLRGCRGLVPVRSAGSA